MREKLDEVSLQQLIDGELDDGRRVQLLALLDEDPPQWRRVAVGFLEKQVWDCAIGGPLHAHQADADHAARTRPSGEPPAWRRTSNWSWLLTLAGCALLGVATGYLQAGRSSDPRPVISSADRPWVAQGPSRLGGLEDALARSAGPVPDDFRRQMLAAGYYIDEVHQLQSVDLPTGETIEMPVRNVNLHYLGAAAFQ